MLIIPWFKVDDGLAFHRKVVKAGNAAMGLWVRAGAWAANELTDGFVPEHIVRTLGTPNQARRLVAANLWITVDGGYQFHEWTEDGRQPTRKEILKRRAREAERKAKARAAKSANTQVDEQCPTGTDSGHPTGVPNGVRSTRPDPTRSVLGSRYLEGEGHVPNAREKPPSPRCPKHAEVEHPPPCGDCADARRRAENHASEAEREQLRFRQVLADARNHGRQQCQHGTPGGALINPTTGMSATCPTCRGTQ